MPGITVAETGDQVVTVPVESFRQVAEALRNDKDEPMDFLRDIVGMDWQEGHGSTLLSGIKQDLQPYRSQDLYD